MQTLEKFETSGAEHHPCALTAKELNSLTKLFDGCDDIRPGIRVFGDTILSELLVPGGTIDGIARSKLGAAAKPVRALLFDKTEKSNWALGWHQDRTIAVKDRLDVHGFGPWSQKDGIPHVEPPFAILDAMVTLRAHLDPCNADNAPLKISPGSHNIGRISADIVTDQVARLGAYTCTAERGDIWLYSTPILHASDAARRPRHRRVLQVDFAASELPGELQWYGI